MDAPLTVLLVAWLACVGLSLYMAAQRGRSAAEGFWLGFLFGPLGVIAVGLLPVVDDAEEMRRLKAREARERSLVAPEPEEVPIAFDRIGRRAAEEGDDLIRP